jgi:hypothetical protein
MPASFTAAAAKNKPNNSPKRDKWDLMTKADLTRVSAPFCALVDCNRVHPQPPRALLSTRPRLPTTAIARTPEPSTRMQIFAIILVIFVGIRGILSTTRVSLS